jgi:hypothetical protein
MVFKNAQIRSQLLRIAHYKLVCSALYTKFIVKYADLPVYLCVFQNPASHFAERLNKVFLCVSCTAVAGEGHHQSHRVRVP